MLYTKTCKHKAKAKSPIAEEAKKNLAESGPLDGSIVHRYSGRTCRKRSGIILALYRLMQLVVSSNPLVSTVGPLVSTTNLTSTFIEV